ncbi:ganglioside GM2 activator-like [Neocloeon triangulifer]|uniref:ganglioside GM2 activator-like n=1 Tax=Neocloeon triangulifer TaxID=2078957 RepID=UPI00286F56B6|nr:ganglioside GM2 activator-like [Neocloeon triangulifer]
MLALKYLGFICFWASFSETHLASHLSQTQTVVRKKLKLRSTTWSNCGSDTDSVLIQSLDVAPDFIHIPGNITVSAQVSVNSNILSPVKVDVVAKRKTILGWIEIPCWQQEFGSCKFEDACTLSPYASACPKFFADHNIPCHCPILKGAYGVSNVTMMVDLAVPDWLEKGFYKAQVKVSQEDQQLACYEFQSHFA